jgi:glycosyltransferase involved in cell wall biosynthesis
MKVALGAGHFMPEVGYQEVYLARAYSRLGHVVRVFTSDRISPSARGFLARRRYEPGLTHDAEDGYSVLRLPARVEARSIVLARGLKRAVDEFDPDVVLALGVGKLFPTSLFRDRPTRRYRLAALFADNSDFWDFTSTALAARSVRSKLSQRLLKDIAYRRAVRCADRVCAQTPETKEIVGSSLSPRLRRVLEEKHVLLPLGYDPGEFSFSAEERVLGRAELGLDPDECLFVTCTRVNAKKSLEHVIDATSSLRARGYPVRYVIAGLLADDYGRALESYIEQQLDPSVFHWLPFLDHQRMRRLYCSADVGVWRKAAISIQEAMGTGLPLLLESKPSVAHLVEDGVNGWHFDADGFDEAMRRAYAEAHLRPREQIAANNAARLSYDVIAQRLLDSVLSAS